MPLRMSHKQVEVLSELDPGAWINSDVQYFALFTHIGGSKQYAGVPWNNYEVGKHSCNL